MSGKNNTTKDNLFEILNMLEDLNIRYWVDGGWGIDILSGKQNRVHRDIDIDFDSKYEAVLLSALKEKGYVITTDWSPCRIELFHPELGYLDIHPLIINEDGSARQADPDGGWYDFEAKWFSQASFEGRLIPCLSAEAQKLFHSGYELREVDKIDIKILGSIRPELFS